MLSSANVFLLGVVDAGPINPYEIVCRFAYNRYNKLLHIADSTIYANIRMMYKKGYLQYELQQDGMMPAKKLYTLTETGREELKASLREALSSDKADFQTFAIGLLLMHYFPKTELQEMLKKHKKALEEIIEEREKDYLFVSEVSESVPCIQNVSSSYLVYREIQAELDTTVTTLESLEHTEEEWLPSTFEVDAEYRQRYQEMEK